MLSLAFKNRRCDLFQADEEEQQRLKKKFIPKMKPKVIKQTSTKSKKQINKKPEEKPIKNNLPKKHKPEGYKFVKKYANPPPHVAFRRVGVYAGGRISQQIEDKNPNTHYYIRFDNNDFDIVGFLDSKYNPKQIFSESNNAVPPRSISQKELIPKLNKILKD